MAKTHMYRYSNCSNPSQCECVVEVEPNTALASIADKLDPSRRACRDVASPIAILYSSSDLVRSDELRA